MMVVSASDVASLLYHYLQVALFLRVLWIHLLIMAMVRPLETILVGLNMNVLCVIMDFYRWNRYTKTLESIVIS